MSATMKINAVICTHGWRGLLPRTLESLAEAARPAGFERLWVIENGSDDGARGLCQRMSERLPLRYVHLATKGKSRALQHALDVLRDGLVIFLDDDIRVGPGLFEAYAKAAEAHGPESFFGGPVFAEYEAAPPAWLMDELPPSAKGWQAEDATVPITKSCFLGANYGAFVPTLQRVGGYKSHLGVGSEGNPVGEEFEIQDRLLAAGCRGVYLSEAQVWHWVPRDRCSASWVRRRHYRIWLTNGLTDGKVHSGPRLADAPRWMWRRVLKLGVQAAAATFIPDARKRFEIKDRYWQWRGYVDGVRLRAKQARRNAGGDLPMETSHE